MSTLLIKNASFVATMDKNENELRDVSIFCENGVIKEVGDYKNIVKNIDKEIDANDLIVIPGLINTHHHLFQNLTRVYKPAQNKPLFGWLTSLYPIWQNINPSDIYISS